MKKGRILWHVMILTMIFLLSACKNAPEEAAENKVKDDLSGTITVWTWKAESESVKHAAEKFMGKHNGVKVEIKELNEQEMYTRLEDSFSQGKDMPDLLTVSTPILHAYVDKFQGKFVDLTDVISPMKDKFIKSQLAEATIEGKIMAFPWDSAPVVMFYRKDIFDNAGIKAEDIKTWGEYIEAGRKISSKSGGKIKMLPVDESGSDEFYRLLLGQLGTGYYNKDGKSAVNSEKAVRAMSLIKEMHTSGIVYNAPYASVLKSFKEGSLAAFPADISMALQLINESKEIQGKVEVMNLPAFEPGGNNSASFEGSAVLMPKKEQGNKAVLDFVEFLTTDRDNVIFAVTHSGIVPADAEYYNESWTAEKLEFFDFQRIWRIAVETAGEEMEINYSPDFTDIQSRVIEAQKKILMQNASVEAVLTDIYRLH